MKLKSLSILFISFLLTLGNTFSQTIFKYGEKKVSQKEFVEAFKKNHNDNTLVSEQEIKDYLELYALFKMRLEAGYQAGVKESEAFKNELKTYENQLVNTFVYERAIEDQLLHEALERQKEERLFAHILLPVSKPSDSAKVKKEIDKIYHEIRNGNISFEEAAKKYSNDKSSAQNGGEVGYIGPFAVVYEVENAVYNTNKGQISQPFTSTFGYHIVKVKDVRPASGKVEVAQILIPTKEGRELAENVLVQLKQGADFEKLVELYSKDAFTVDNKGKMKAFSVGKMDANFEKAAFELKKKGDYSDIIKTDYGYHILKLIDKHKYEENEETIQEIKVSIQNDSRKRLAKKEVLGKLLQKYGYKENTTNLKNLISSFMQNKTSDLQMDVYGEKTEELFQLKGKKYTIADLFNNINKKTNGRVFGTKSTFIEQMLEAYLEELVLDYERIELINNNSEFKNLIKDYKEGMVIFQVMEENVWKINDEEDIRRFYEENKENYTFGPGFEGIIYVGENEKDIENLKKRMENGMEFQDALDIIDAGRGNVRFRRDRGKFNYADISLSNIQNMDLNTFSSIYKDSDGYYKFINIDKHYDGKFYYTFEEVKTRINMDYQNKIENDWNDELRSVYPLEINKKVLKKVVRELTK
ncbi:MAG TPA: peptidylprolyl isomerase [Chitinophagaceae bacterium]|nr:peptidylprolyl isomerase [Chitinophagaceae bacterium]